MHRLRNLNHGILCALALIMGLLGAGGCGGGGGSCSDVTRAFEFDLVWGERSRHVDGPNSALSVRVKVITGRPDGGTVMTAPFNRPDGTASVTQKISINQDIRIGTREVVLEFFTQKDGGGARVGFARSFVDLRSDGSGADDVAVDGVVKKVTVVANQSLAIGEERELAVTVRDDDDNVLALSPGSVFLSIASGHDFLEILPDGKARAKAAGTAAVVATVDDTQSDATPVKVNPLLAAPRFTINWAARSKAIAAPSSARSAIVTLFGAAEDGSDVVLPVINRRSDPAAYSDTITGATPVVVGTWNFTAQFYADANGGGDVVGVASGAAPVNTDGNGIDSVTLETVGTIVSCEVVPGPALLVGQTRALGFTARDQNGTAVAVSPGSAFWTRTEGNALTLLAEGTATGVSAGQVKVTVSVDGKVSPPTAVSVTSNMGGIDVGIK